MIRAVPLRRISDAFDEPTLKRISTDANVDNNVFEYT